ncbi:ABC transporter ATP-binding protein [Candidatus Poribacteria bacterium]|jgi:putative ABC transport system ATP-binding protein|nr:ABC transporter ATP-binding protein [Candidatus Poribacteria bacterium]MBT5537105.1 ABC transporter ATP-binding protein [Candidatus Poribacteria bacterium]MBT5710850.1 ABC transporter ATP-binding protein [Candidatus Poribacteria bacterium]MBT7100583.1 ABC transporter ATP-binding protein [Candidatus Poribacteria bacterium]MBT7806904.1 ABC transporter ATP-binding protein [Candidatus Poribacteria bacterium]
MSIVLEGVGLTKRYGEGGGQVTAVDGVDMTLGRGEMVVVMGDSGCGKTTLISMLGCILTPTSGDVLLDGERVPFGDVKALPRLRSERIGFVFQMFNLVPYLTAAENVLLALDIAGVTGSKAETRAEELLGDVGLSGRVDHRPGQLSGGEKQRVSFARALANRPSVIFADEPTANLDSTQSQNLMDLIRGMREQHDTAIVVVTHHLALHGDADQVIQMQDGRVVGDGEPAPA